jgi:hypothetical protein
MKPARSGRANGLNDLDELHHRRRVEEMHPDDLLGPFCCGGERDHRKR